MNKKVDTVQTNIGDTGKVSIPSDTIGEGTTAIITMFDDTTESVGRFKSGVEELSGQGVDLSTITSEFERVQDSITTTYHITDEFTKIKIDTMVSALGDAIPELASAWDSLNGTLSASKQELESYMYRYVPHLLIHLRYIYMKQFAKKSLSYFLPAVKGAVSK